MKNGEERWRFFTKSLTETSRKRYGSASAWIFFTETIFLTNFKRILTTRRAERYYSTLFPLFIGKKRDVVAAKLAQASWVASTRRHRLLLEPPGRPKWAWLLFAHPFLLNTPLFAFFADSFFVTLRNLTDYAMTLIFFSKCRETLRIMQQCPFWPLECCRTLQIARQCSLSTSGMSRNFTDYLTMGVKYLEAVKRRLHATKQWSPDEIRLWQLPLFTYLLLEIKAK